MKTFILFLILTSGIGVPAWCHEAPTPINHMDWVVDSGLLRVRFQTDAPWWVLNVFGEQTPPPTDWPPDLERLAKDYFDRHFIVRGDGKVLNCTMISHRYSEEVWRYYLGSKLELSFYYVLPSTVQTLSCQATFYKEGKEGPFETHVEIDGAPRHSVVLTLEHPDASFAFAAIVRSRAQRWRDDCLDGMQFWEIMPWLLMAFGAFQLQLRTRVTRKTYYAALLTAAGGCSLFLNMHKNVTSGYGAGAFLVFITLALLVELGLQRYNRRLQNLSESQADRLFTSQIRFVSLLLVGMTFFLIAQYIQKPL